MLQNDDANANGLPRLHSRDGYCVLMIVPAVLEAPQVTADVPRFELGEVVTTPGVADLGIDVRPYLERHAAGDWGDVSEADAAENEFSVTRPLRIFSAYNTPGGRIWVITEADRRVTTVLLPGEY